MDRLITYSGQIPLDTDILRVGRYAKIGMGNLAMQLYGAESAAWGFGITRSTSDMTLTIAPGFVLSVAPVDAAAIGGNGGGLPADAGTTENQYYSTNNTIITIPATGTVYTVYAHCYEQDAGNTVLPFYNANNPSQTQAGPNNLGNPLPTVRSGVVDLIVSIDEPSVDIGFTVPLFTASVPTGATNTNSVVVSYYDLFYPTIPELARGRLLNVQRFVSSGTYTPTSGTKTIIVEVQGGGASGYGCTGQAATGTCSVGSGGNAGTYLKGMISNPNECLVTIAAQTENGTNGSGLEGNTTAFGAYVNCPGGGAPTGANQISAPWVTGAHSWKSPIFSDEVSVLEILGDSVGGEGVAISTGVGWGASGASSKFGAGGGNSAQGVQGSDGGGYGAGGGGTFSPSGGAALSGGKGSAGLVIVYEYS